MLMEEPNGNRFRISQEAVQPVVDDQLIPVPITVDNFVMDTDGKYFKVTGL